MTADERFDRLEHITAGIAEERQKDREEYKALWRDRQRRTNDLRNQVEALAVETRLRFEQVADRFDRSATAWISSPPSRTLKTRPWENASTSSSPPSGSSSPKGKDRTNEGNQPRSTLPECAPRHAGRRTATRPTTSPASRAAHQNSTGEWPNGFSTWTSSYWRPAWKSSESRYRAPERWAAASMRASQ